MEQRQSDSRDLAHNTTEMMTPILILMVPQNPIQILCFKQTYSSQEKAERLLDRKSLLGCLSHFGHLPILLPQDRTGFLLSTMSYLGSSYVHTKTI